MQLYLLFVLFLFSCSSLVVLGNLQCSDDCFRIARNGSTPFEVCSDSVKVCDGAANLCTVVQGEFPGKTLQVAGVSILDRYNPRNVLDSILSLEQTTPVKRQVNKTLQIPPSAWNSGDGLPVVYRGGYALSLQDSSCSTGCSTTLVSPVNTFLQDGDCITEMGFSYYDADDNNDFTALIMRLREFDLSVPLNSGTCAEPCNAGTIIEAREVPIQIGNSGNIVFASATKVLTTPLCVNHETKTISADIYISVDGQTAVAAPLRWYGAYFKYTHPEWALPPPVF